MGDIRSDRVLRILTGGAAEPLTDHDIGELLLACVSEAQELGQLQVWATFDSKDRLISVDLFDDDFEILGGDDRWGNTEYAKFFATNPQYMSYEFFEGNFAVDVTFTTPTEFQNPGVKQALVDSLRMAQPSTPLYANMRDYAIAWLAG